MPTAADEEERLRKRREERDRFFAACLRYDCPYCNQTKGNPCRDASLRKRRPHSARRWEVSKDRWAWEREKTRPCPTCAGTGRVKVVGQDAKFFADGNRERLVGPEGCSSESPSDGEAPKC